MAGANVPGRGTRSSQSLRGIFPLESSLLPPAHPVAFLGAQMVRSWVPGTPSALPVGTQFGPDLIYLPAFLAAILRM